MCFDIVQNLHKLLSIIIQKNIDLCADESQVLYI